MHCSEFREHHCSFVDDTLPGIELIRMQRHMVECAGCAEHDAHIRRALLLFRNLPTIEPSSDFSERLEARLQACRVEQVEATYANFRAVAGIGAVASLLMLGYVAVSFQHGGMPAMALVAREHTPTLAPVVALAERPAVVASVPAAPRPHASRPADREPARQPEIVSASSSLPAVAASVSAGMPIWPAAIFAEQAPLHFATYRQTH